MNLRELSDRHDSILQEIREERISALTRISRTLESLLEQLHALRARAEHAAGGLSSREMDEYEALRAKAKQYRWFLEVQREALGLRHHGFLDRFYAVPGPLTNDQRPTANGNGATTNDQRSSVREAETLQDRA